MRPNPFHPNTTAELLDEPVPMWMVDAVPVDVHAVRKVWVWGVYETVVNEPHHPVSTRTIYYSRTPEDNDIRGVCANVFPSEYLAYDAALAIVMAYMATTELGLMRDRQFMSSCKNTSPRLGTLTYLASIFSLKLKESIHANN